MILSGRSPRSLTARRALAWAWETNELGLAMRLGPACLRFWAEWGYYEDANSWLEQSLPVSVEATPVGLNALRAQGLIAFHVIGDSELAGRRWTEAAELARQLGKEEELELIEGGLASVIWEQGDLERAMRLRQEMLAQARVRGDRLREAMYLHWTGEIFGELERFDEAERSLLEADAIYRELGKEPARWNNVHSLGDVALDRHDFRARPRATARPSSPPGRLHAPRRDTRPTALRVSPACSPTSIRTTSRPDYGERFPRRKRTWAFGCSLASGAGTSDISPVSRTATAGS